MGMWVGRGRKARIAYGFDDIALVPGTLTVNPNEVDVSWELCGRRVELPILAAAMDGLSDPRFAIEMGRLGGIARPQGDGMACGVQGGTHGHRRPPGSSAQYYDFHSCMRLFIQHYRHKRL